jgi:hypothetical protein
MAGMSAGRPRQTYKPKRQSVTLTARDLADLDLVRNSPEARRAVGIVTEGMSEASFLHALLAHSLQQAREAADEAGYAALAASYEADPEEQVTRKALRAHRRVRPEADEA